MAPTNASPSRFGDASCSFLAAAEGWGATEAKEIERESRSERKDRERERCNVYRELSVGLKGHLSICVRCHIPSLEEFLQTGMQENFVLRSRDKLGLWVGNGLNYGLSVK